VVLEESKSLSGHPAYTFAPVGVDLTELKACGVGAWMDVLQQPYRICRKLL